MKLCQTSIGAFVSALLSMLCLRNINIVMLSGEKLWTKKNLAWLDMICQKHKHIQR